jgi:hypothetical protein
MMRQQSLFGQHQGDGRDAAVADVDRAVLAAAQAGRKLADLAQTGRDGDGRAIYFVDAGAVKELRDACDAWHKASAALHAFARKASGNGGNG